MGPVSLSLGAGEAALLHGPNGSGKTTLMLGIIGAAESSGRVRVSGRDVTALPTHERGIAYSPAHPVLPGWMRVGDLVRMVGPSAAGILEEFGLGWTLGRRAGSLSTGERKVVQVAMALASDAEVLLLDEPLSNLSEEWASRMLGAILRERRPVVVSHQEVPRGFSVRVRLVPSAGGAGVELERARRVDRRRN
ncbi:MAG: ATP-binding cassette domain-containing protein [Conexivisphaera sp.]